MGKMKNQINVDDYLKKLDEYHSGIDWDLMPNLTVNTTAGLNGTSTSANKIFITGAGSNGSLTVSDSTWTNRTPYVMNQGGRMQITGEDADISMNGKSLKTWMEAVESRLAILEPNTKLEAEWAELKELGDRYRAMEKEIHDKMKTWDILKKPE